MNLINDLSLQTFASNGVLNPDDDTLHIKQERDFIVKTESDIDEHPFILQDMETQINQLRDEKERIIKELVNMKADNQTLNLEIQRKVVDIDRLKQEKISQKSNFNAKISQLEAELSDLKKKISADSGLRANYDKTILNLNTEKRELLARLKQVHQSINEDFLHGHNESANCNATAHGLDGEYEVEYIVKHRSKKGKPEYLVRWKGFSEEHDTWEKEKNLTNCSKVLNAYLNTKTK